MTTQSVLLAAFENKGDAERMFQFLDTRGVKSALADLTTEQPGNAISADFAKYQVRVVEGFEEAAQQATHETDEGLQLLKPAIHCPECGSLKVIYPNIPRNFMFSAVMRWMVKKHLLDGKYLCTSCKNEWAPPGKRAA